MRKLTSYLLVSLNGVVEAPNKFFREDVYPDFLPLIGDTIAEQDAVLTGSEWEFAGKPFLNTYLRNQRPTPIVFHPRGSHGSTHMHNISSFRTARRAGLAVVLLMASCGLALAGPHAGGGFGGAYHGGGFGGGFHGGGSSHGGFGSMHNSSFGHSTSGHFQHSSGQHSSGQHSSGMTRTAMHRSGSHHAASSRHTHLASSHHTHVASDGTPQGFSHGNASWKQNGGTPPGWSHGNKTGWGCSPGSKGCMPPGLAKKQADATDQPTTHTRTPAPSTRTPSHSSPTPASPSRPTPASYKPQPVSHTPGKLPGTGEPQ